MPIHDKYGQQIEVGDEVVVRGNVRGCYDDWLLIEAPRAKYNVYALDAEKVAGTEEVGEE